MPFWRWPKVSPPDVGISTKHVATAPRITYLGAAFRHMAASWQNSLSGEGAQIHGGRFNPPNSFPVLYLCTTRSCAGAELRHRGERLVIGVEGLLPECFTRTPPLTHLSVHQEEKEARERSEPVPNCDLRVTSCLLVSRQAMC